jgi:phosphoglycolate phosphatase-like HAD superfamily hydrolase
MAHIVWDWNGTLLDDLHLVVDAVNSSLQHVGGSPIEPVEYQRHFVRPLHLFYGRILGRKVDDELLRVIDDVFERRYWEAYVDARLAVDAREAVDLVADRGWTQSVASMLRHDLLVRSIMQFDLDERMTAVDGHRGRRGETKEQHMLGHVERLQRMYTGMGRTEMVAIGDVVDDAAAARRAGIR